MKCKKCGSPLPSNGITCKFCGTLMSQEQIAEVSQANIRETKRLEMLSEKYGHQNKVEYRKEEDPRKATYAAIILIVLFLVIFAVILFLLKQA